jgi:hypothetical protein
MPRTVLILILIPFSALSAIALWQVGYWGLLAPHFQTFGGGQVLADLVIALTLVMDVARCQSHGSHRLALDRRDTDPGLVRAAGLSADAQASEKALTTTQYTQNRYIKD